MLCLWQATGQVKFLVGSATCAAFMLCFSCEVPMWFMEDKKKVSFLHFLSLTSCLVRSCGKRKEDACHGVAEDWLILTLRYAIIQSQTHEQLHTWQHLIVSCDTVGQVSDVEFLTSCFAFTFTETGFGSDGDTDKGRHNLMCMWWMNLLNLNLNGSKYPHMKL